MFKKILCIMLAVMMCFALASCSSGKADGNSVTCGDTALVGVWVVEEQKVTVTPEKKDEETEDAEEEENNILEMLQIIQFLSNGVCYRYDMIVTEDREVIYNEDASTWYAESGIIILDTDRLDYKLSGKKLTISSAEFDEYTEDGTTKVYRTEAAMTLKRSNKTAAELLEGVQKRANKGR